ncbi:MAG: RidA family protein [Myxococcales bacterium]|nr:RidA family protein [Myxococcales bacterium]
MSASERRRVSTDRAPAAIGPYAQAIAARGLLFTSGQIGLDPSTGELVEGGTREQVERVMENLAAVLEAAGTGFDRVVKATIFLVDLADFAVVNEVYGRWFAGMTPPARSTLQVAALPRGARVEIELVALI